MRPQIDVKARLHHLKWHDKNAAATTLRAWFRQDFEGAWAKLSRDYARDQGVLSLGPDGGELPLDDAIGH
jgi:hypothetical protein